MWSKTGLIPDMARADRNASASSTGISLYFQPLGFLENIWKVSQEIACARPTDCAIDPAIDM